MFGTVIGQGQLTEGSERQAFAVVTSEIVLACKYAQNTKYTNTQLQNTQIQKKIQNARLQTYSLSTCMSIGSS